MRNIVFCFFFLGGFLSAQESESPYELESLSPNPAFNQVQVNYQAQGAVSAYITITSVQSPTSNNYILNTEESTMSINLSGYVPGIYVVTLVCNGEVIESKNLAIQ